MKILLFKGGRSVEHEVSLKSAAYTARLLKKMGHEVIEVSITLEGMFFTDDDELSIRIPYGFFTKSGRLNADLAVIMIHGYGGEDGRLESILELLEMPYVSEDSATSSVGMHKALQLALFRECGLKTARTLCISRPPEDYSSIINGLGKDIIVKPEAGGSSVGIEIVKNASPASLEMAIQKSFEYDSKLLLQTLVSPMREVECGLYYDWEKNELNVLPPLEIDTGDEFLSYDAKYSKPVKTGKARLTAEETEELKGLAKKAFNAVGASMYLRADFFKTPDGFLINEINTIPGFTAKSHYPKMAGGEEGAKKIFAVLINNALLRAKREKAVVRIYD